MTDPAWATMLASLSAAGAVALLLPVRPRPDVRTHGPEAADDGTGWLRRHRAVWAVLSAIGAATVVGGPLSLPAGFATAVVVWIVIERAESPVLRAERDAVRRDLPAVVTLLASALRSGAAPGESLSVVAAALPGPASDRLVAVAARLRLGGDPTQVWAALERDDELAVLGRVMGRAHATGAPVVTSIERLADDLARAARGDAEDRARAIGVKAAVPLGLCLLPSFVLIGIVPLVAGLVATMGW